MKNTIRLGSRGSPLALIQAEDVRKKLKNVHPNMGSNIEIVPIRTTGDWKPEQKDKSFIELGGNKGLFTKEIEEALLSGHIDMAVHSMKDVASVLPPGLAIAALLERVDARDAFIGRNVRALHELPAGSVVGTSSLRRQSQILALRPDLKVVPLRGNVETRLKKLNDGLVDATLLAVAGLTRLNMTQHISSILDFDIMLPAAAQGVVGIEIRQDDEDLRQLLMSLNDRPTRQCVTAERALLKILDGNCQTPIGVYAHHVANDQLKLDAIVARKDGTGKIQLSDTAPAQDAEKLGIQLGTKLKSMMSDDYFAV